MPATVQRIAVFLALCVLLLILLAAGVASYWWHARAQAQPFRMVLRGSSSVSDKLRVSGGNLVVVAPQPGVFFGTVARPNGPEEFTYVILFRYGRPASDGGGQGIQFRASSDGRSAETSDAIELDGKRIEAVYRIELDETRTEVAREQLTIGGRQREMAAGQVFLIDLSAEEPEYEQLRLELPPISGRLETTEDVERLAGVLKARLESQDPRVTEFLK